MNEKKMPTRLLKEGRFTMHPPMEPTYFIEGVENWPRAVRPEIVQPTVVAGSPPAETEPATPAVIPPAGD